MNDQKALQLNNISKVYVKSDKSKETFKAVDGISLNIDRGDFFALLGPNGAGKSTTIGMISSLVNKTEGEIKIFGFDLDKETTKAKKMLGIMPQEINLAIFETPIKILINQAGYYGIPRKQAKINAEKRLKEMQLWDKRTTQVRFLSGGMKRRLMVARALVHDPKLLILDEPTAGVDVEIRHAIWEVLTKLNEKEDLTIILTTHYLEEAEMMCNKIALINKGQVFANTTMKELLRDLDQEVFVFDLKKSLESINLNNQNIKAELIDAVTLEITVNRDTTLNDIFKILSENNIEVISARNKKARLEQLFIDLVNKNNLVRAV